MAEAKTKPTGVSVTEFLTRVEDPQRRADSKVLVEMMSRITGEKPRMWGPTIIGFGQYHYKYASGHEGDMARIGFSPRAKEQVLYVLDGTGWEDPLLARLGKHKTGKCCLYVKRLSDVDETVLEEIAVRSWQSMNERYPEGA